MGEKERAAGKGGRGEGGTGLSGSDCRGEERRQLGTRQPGARKQSGAACEAGGSQGRSGSKRKGKIGGRPFQPLGSPIS